MSVETAKSEKYQMPKPGMFVTWSFGLGQDVLSAAVTRVGKNAIEVMVFPPDHRGAVPASGVVHVSDPRAKNTAPEAGVWDFLPEQKWILALEEKIGNVSNKLDDLISELGSK